jgi:hypothetical protein
MCVVVSIFTTLHENICNIKLDNELFESVEKFIFQGLEALAVAHGAHYSANIPRRVVESVDASEIMDGG